ncbi:unnamed protein product [Blepharisma stoltei]|uniref:Uncharacterized protein n=1 Tax=Blepharisma stoltei TaxID=1481888 RepID=A0AAU9JCQ0_9CILI|nr:unnamed protein product [Blepharisma stoltei]
MGPLMNGILFQPVLTMLSRITQCDHGSGPNLTDSYFNYDCHFSCWKSQHVTILAETIFIVFIYIAISIKIRPLWQENQFDLNIKEDPSCMAIKAAVQISLIAVYETLKKTNQIVHCSIYLFIMICFVIFISIRKSFNYDRASLLQVSLIVCVIWNSTLSLAYMVMNNGHPYIWTATQFLGIFGIIMCSLFVDTRLKKNMLIKKEGKSIVELFRFSLMGDSFWSKSSMAMSFEQRFRRIYSSEQEFIRVNAVFPIDAEDSPRMLYISYDKGDDSNERIGLSSI